jgi:hypothetical protein
LNLVFQDTCRRLTCPLTYTALYGKCVGRYTRTNGISVSILLEIWPVDIDRSSDLSEITFSDDSDNLNKLATIVSNTIVKPKVKCKHCFTSIRSYDNNGDLNITAVITYQTTEKCKLEKLYSRLYAYAKASSSLVVSLDINNNRFKFKTAIKHDYRMEDFGIFGHDQTKEIKKCDQSYFYFGELICPKIMLNETEYKILMAKATFKGPVRQTSKSCSDINDNEDDANMEASGNRALNTDERCTFFEICIHDFSMALNNGVGFRKSYSMNTIIVTMFISTMCWR